MTICISVRYTIVLWFDPAREIVTVCGSPILLMKKILLIALTISLIPAFAAEKGDALLSPKAAGKDFVIQGEYSGEDAEGERVGLNIIALGDGKFRGVGFMGGLPGDGWDQGEKLPFTIKSDGDKMIFTDPDTNEYEVKIKGGKLMAWLDGNKSHDLKKVTRKSPTMGAKPSKGAVILFDGTSVDKFKNAKLSEDKLLVPRADSIQRFGSHKLHIEFFLPFKPKARGQGRGNSGCYLQGRYEVQVLDSFGLEGKNNECGGIYSIKAPDLNMCYPPLSWQTYDIEFTAAKFKDGKKLEDARMTVLHNGVKIHDNVKLPKRTTASPLPEGAEPGYLHLQDHGNPVRYRNIWVLETD